ncbi:MAG TPA: hypothetical protein VEV38_14690 [Candidatus Eremiobacteraceae bacterium]|nr:hypothetical protein [Candidatus Eremiobacteraceae bacterium]
MTNRKHSSLSFWSVALAAAAIALFSSVQLGKAIGGELLAHGVVGKSVAQAPPVSVTRSEVVGARPFVAGAPGQPAPR